MALIKGVSLTALLAPCVGYWRHTESRCISVFRQRSRDLSEEQENWRTQFENIGETQLYQLLLKGAISASDARHTPALEWLREQETTRRLREQEAYSYTQRAAVAAVIVGMIGVVATLIH
jgi:hypothetical protein